MSLKFGIYLVEQRIVSPEQFCGLVKIQQESTRTLASLAITHNFLTMKQVSRILDEVKDEGPNFIAVASDWGMLDKTDASHLLKLQSQSGETICSLAVECGLLTQRQAEVLFNHFERYGSRAVKMKKRAPMAKPVAPATMPAAPGKSHQPADAVRPPKAAPRTAPSPKFKQRPIITVEESQH